MIITNNLDNEVIDTLAVVDQLEILQELFDKELEDARDYFAFSRVIEFLKRQEPDLETDAEWFEYE